MNRTTSYRMPLLGIMLAAAIALGGLVGCGTASSGSAQGATYQQVSSQEAASMMEAESGYVILDVRTPEEYAEGHIPNAINVPVETIDSEPAELADKSQLILVYCRSGNRSKQASQKLADLGYDNVIEFGGIRDWSGDVVTEG